MEFNTNNRLAQNESRFSEAQRASGRRNAELEATAERVRGLSEDASGVIGRIQPSADSIEISSSLAGADETDRSGRIAELRAAVEDGSLFDHERLERAATRLLSDRA